MGTFFHEVFYEPIFNALFWLIRVLPGHDLGLAIIAITVVIRLILIWPSIQQIRSSKSMQALSPKLKALQKEFANDKQELARRTMQLYRDHKVSWTSGCLPLLIQLPFLFAMYQVFIGGLQVDPATKLLTADHINDLYGPLRAVADSTPIGTTFLGFLNVTASKNIVLALIVGATQYFQAKMLNPKANPPTTQGAKDEQMATAMSRQMTIIMPIFIAYISYVVPAGLGLYFLASNIFSIVQQWLILRKDGQATPAVVAPPPPTQP